MAVLDIQVTNASLRDIVGSLGATLEEGSWISTSYLVAEIVVIPLSGWLCEVFSTRRYLLGTATLFLIFSVGCGWAWNLESLICFRVLQGFTGGALIPIAFNLVLRLLPVAHRAIGFALFGMTATFAPAIGPTIGGWLTESYGWPAIFYLNLIPGAFLLTGVAWGLKSEHPNIDLLRRGDWWGILTMTGGLGMLIVVLEEGNRHEWFSSALITWLTVGSGVCLSACVLIELSRAEPFLNLRLLKNRNFLTGSLVGMAFGAGMYGATYLLPLYLAQVQGYNARQIGETIMWSGVPQLFMMPMAVVLLRRVDSRVLVTVGLILFGWSGILNASMTHETGHDQLRITQLIRALGMPLVIVPITSLATGHIRSEQSGSASALFNMFRNLGGSIGIAMLARQLDVREKLHSFQIGEALNLCNPLAAERFEAMQLFFTKAGSNGVDASMEALKALSMLVRRESYVLSYGDAFMLLGSILIATAPLVWVCRRTRTEGSGVH